MFLEGRALNEIDWAWLEWCRERGIEESRTLDFKRQLPDLSSDREKREFLHDICGFANTEGGLLLYGVGEVDGRMQSLDGCDLRGDTPETFADRLERMVRSGLDPAFGSFRVVGITQGTETETPACRVVAIGVERSSYAPHRVVAHDSRRFMIRMLKSTVEMDTELIREQFRRSFIAMEDATDRLNRAKERFAATGAPELRFPTARLWMAVVPFYRNALSYPLRSAEVKEALEAQAHTHSYLNTTYLHFDSIGAFLRTNSIPYPLVRLNRDGTVERTDLVDVGGPEGNRVYLSATSLRDRLAGLFASIEDLRRRAGVTGPALVSVSLRGINGLQLYQYNDSPAMLPTPFSDDLMTADFDLADEAAFGDIRKNVADFLWQSAGHRECSGFAENGALAEPRSR